jgi:hypothetical protein
MKKQNTRQKREFKIENIARDIAPFLFLHFLYFQKDYVEVLSVKREIDLFLKSQGFRPLLFNLHYSVAQHLEKHNFIKIEKMERARYAPHTKITKEGVNYLNKMIDEIVKLESLFSVLIKKIPKASK